MSKKILALYESTQTEMEFVAEVRASIQALDASDKTITFGEDVTILPAEGEKGEKKFVKAGDVVHVTDFGDVYIVPGEIGENYKVPDFVLASSVEQPQTPSEEEVNEEILRRQLLDEARDKWGLTPHHLLGVKKLKEAIAAEKARRIEAGEELPEGESADDDSNA